ncbi:hypothetical protein Tco_1156964 [Tanacetum coccineum]
MGRSQMLLLEELEGAVQQGYTIRTYTHSTIIDTDAKTFGENVEDDSGSCSALKEHEVHANENRIMMERFSQPNNDPLALVSDASVQQYPTQSSKSPQSSAEPYPSDSFQIDSGNEKVVVQDVRGRYNVNNQGRPFQRNNARGNGVARNVGGQNRGGIINPGDKVTPQSVDDDVDDSPENDLALNVDHVFEANECDAFDSDVDEGPITQTMFMTNLTSEDQIYRDAGTSYD